MAQHTEPCTLPQPAREACHHPVSLLVLEGPGEARFFAFEKLASEPEDY